MRYIVIKNFKDICRILRICRQSRQIHDVQRHIVMRHIYRYFQVYIIVFYEFGIISRVHDCVADGLLFRRHMASVAFEHDSLQWMIMFPALRHNKRNNAYA